MLSVTKVRPQFLLVIVVFKKKKKRAHICQKFLGKMLMNVTRNPHYVRVHDKPAQFYRDERRI